jgi:hypothetical protein
MMKKLLCVGLVAPAFLMAELDVEQINSTLSSIEFIKPLKFFSPKEKTPLTKNLNLTSLEEANIVLFPEKIENHKMNIVSSYKELQMNQNSIGAIYEKKGRTQIIFIKERLENNGLTLPFSFQKNILSECQVNPTCLLNLY